MSAAAEPFAVAVILIGVTFVLRALPILLLTRLNIPPLVERWLRVAGDAVVVSVIVLIVFFNPEQGRPEVHGAITAGLAVTGLLCVVTRVIFIGIAGGTMAYAALTVYGF
jgi:branched-subunit amino acid transport protein